MAALVDQSQSTTIEEYLQSARDEGAEIFQPDIEVSFLGSIFFGIFQPLKNFQKFSN